MKIHEYQAKEILKQYGVAIPEGGVASTPEEAATVYQSLGKQKVVVKAQIHAGGRGKGGGVKLAGGTEEVRKVAHEIIGMQLITYQTGKEGQKVKKVLVEAASNIQKELYFGIVLDRASSKIALMVSTEGGVDIEKVAHETPEKIVTEFCPVLPELPLFKARRLAYALGLKGDLQKSAILFFRGLYKVFVEKDCSLLEINPMVITAEQKLFALDAKINFDDNSLYRHPEIVAYRDTDEENPREVEASRFGLNYISLDGNIGCMVNGAGLAMGTMDTIKLHGGEPANFLDVGGSANTEQVKEAFRIITSDKNVKGILVNIFGGIMKCDVIAQGIIEASKQINLKIPLVVRLEGTNVAIGKKLLTESGLAIIAADNLEDAAKKVVAAIR